MKVDDAKQVVTEEVNRYQVDTKRKAYLSKSDFYFFVGALCYCDNDLDRFAIMNDIREKLDVAEVKATKNAY